MLINRNFLFLIALFSIGCVNTAQIYKEGGIEIDSSKLRDEKIEVLPKEVALEYLNSNFKLFKRTD